MAMTVLKMDFTNPLERPSQIVDFLHCKKERGMR
jgi:hypothetical protein